MIKKSICIKEFQNKSLIDGMDVLYNKISGITDNGSINYYTGQTNSDAYVSRFNILLLQNIDDIGFYSPSLDEWKSNTEYKSGNSLTFIDNSYNCILDHTSGEYFDDIYWIKTPINDTGYTVTITGESNINLFRRYGKTDIDSDLYNSFNNTEFNQVLSESNGIYKQITSQKQNTNSLSYQPLYSYNLTGESGVIISYSDIGNGNSEISYKTSGLTDQNSINLPNIKLDHLIGVVSAPKINVDVFIDRGSNSSYDRHTRLGDIKSLNDLETYGNGFYKIKED